MNKRIVLIAILLLGLMAAAATVMAREALLEGEQTTSHGGAGMTADDMSTLRGLFGRAGRRAEGLDELFGLSAANQADDNANDNDDNANDNGDDNANDNDDNDDDNSGSGGGDDDDDDDDNSGSGGGDDDDDDHGNDND